MKKHISKDKSVISISAVVSMSPVQLLVPNRDHELGVRVSAPVSGTALPIIIFSHGFGSSMDAYAPLVNYWAAHGFVVIQPTFLDSRTLSLNLQDDHSQAIKAYLHNPLKSVMWRYRVDDLKTTLDQLELIEDAVPGLKGRLDKNRIAAVGHSFGAQTTATLLGTRVIGTDGNLSEDFTDSRIKAGILLSVGGCGGEALSPFAKEHFPHLNQSYAEMKVQTLVVAGDHDRSPLTVKGPEWFTDAFYESPGANNLLVLFGGEHMLGGISGYLVKETTDENPERVLAVQQLTWAYLISALYPDDLTWQDTTTLFRDNQSQLGKVISK
ncbi:chlorophyllase [Mucilaginibacter sp. PAMC 26640]|nr:chlorophyllase [Mucilaginibacter sp. PAMC 26640]